MWPFTRSVRSLAVAIAVGLAGRPSARAADPAGAAAGSASAAEAGGAAADPAAADPPAPAADAPPPAADARAPAPAPPLRPHEGWRQELGMEWHASTFLSNEGSRYTFHSFGLAYLASAGKTGLFVHGSVLLPLQARQDGRVYKVDDFYRVRFGGDLLLGWHGRFDVGRDLELEAGPGGHVALVWLRGKVGYRDFSAMPVGVGGMGVLRWRPGVKLWLWPVTLGGFGSLAWDLYDPLRANDLKYGFTFRAGLLAGIASE